MNIIMVANQPWDHNIGSNFKNIALELSKENTIVYVNPPIDRKLLVTKGKDPFIKKSKEVIDKKIPALEKVQRNVWRLFPDFIAESINSIPIPFIHDFLNKRTNYKLAEVIKKAISSLQLTDYIIFNDSLMMRGFYLKEMLNPAAHIYYIRDYLISQPYFRKHGARLEGKLIAKSDIVLTNSIFLQEYARKHNSNSHYVGQGCEFDIFNHEINRPRPEELKDITYPVIGYIGYLSSMRLDIDLIEYIAAVKSQWVIVLVGPEDENFQVSKLHKIKNVVFTGKKKPEELPAFVQHFDVCINPQQLNDLTIGNYPRKIDEYLAMGKPTVATRTKAMEVFDSYCYLASTPAEFVLMLEWCLAGKSIKTGKERIEFARSHTWENNVKEMCSTIKGNIPSLFCKNMSANEVKSTNYSL